MGVTGVKLDVSTWNCFGMGQRVFDAITHAHAPRRERLSHAEVIAACAAPDLLCVQELFSRDAQIFFDGLSSHGFSTSVRDDNRVSFRSGTVRGNGLGIASRHAIARRSQHHFRARCTGWDRLARKGALYAQVDLGDGTLADVLTCHLQAGSDPGAAGARFAQLIELRAIIDSVGANERPFIVCGDFNIDGHGAARAQAEYQHLFAVMQDFVDLGAASDLPTYEPHPERNSLAHAFNGEAPSQRIDYVFFRAAADAAIACTKVERILDRPLSSPSLEAASREHASDHYGLRAVFERAA